MNEIRVRREAKGISQVELARCVGVTVAAISRYENGKRTPDAECLVKIADVLDCKAEDLMRPVFEKIKADLEANGVLTT